MMYFKNWWGSRNEFFNFGNFYQISPARGNISYLVSGNFPLFIIPMREYFPSWMIPAGFLIQNMAISCLVS